MAIFLSYGSRGVGSVTITARSIVAGKYDTGAVANGLHFNLKRSPRQREPTRSGDDSLDTLQPIPSDISPPAKLHFPLLPKQLTNWD